jgi:hypothetical protein
MGTKRLSRKMLARFPIIFFNWLSENWKVDHNKPEHIFGTSFFAELD